MAAKRRSGASKGSPYDQITARILAELEVDYILNRRATPAIETAALGEQDDAPALTQAA